MNKNLVSVLIFIHFQLFTQSANLNYGAENTALGNTVSTSQNAFAVFANPSSVRLSNDSSTSLLLNANRYIHTDTYFRMGLGFYKPIKKNGLHLGIHKFGNSVYNETKCALGYSFLLNNISIGLITLFHNYSAEGYRSINLWSFNLGGSVILHPKLTWGTYISNITQSKIHYSPKEYLTQSFATGLLYTVTKEVYIKGEIEKRKATKPDLKLGLSYSFSPKTTVFVGLSNYFMTISSGLKLENKKILFSCAYSYNKYLSSELILTLGLRFLK
ncbi:MAG: hypothetical protein U0V72_12460 [Cytophagales bacterium]